MAATREELIDLARDRGYRDPEAWAGHIAEAQKRARAAPELLCRSRALDAAARYAAKRYRYDIDILVRMTWPHHAVATPEDAPSELRELLHGLADMHGCRLIARRPPHACEPIISYCFDFAPTRPDQRNDED